MLLKHVVAGTEVTMTSHPKINRSPERFVVNCFQSPSMNDGESAERHRVEEADSAREARWSTMEVIETELEAHLHGGIGVFHFRHCGIVPAAFTMTGAKRELPLLNWSNFIITG